MPENISATIPIIYGVCLLLAAALLIFYVCFVKEKHVWMDIILKAVCITNIGYLYLSLAPNRTNALIANGIAYLGNAFVPILMFLTIANICRIKIPKPFIIVSLCLAVVLLVSVWTTTALPIFYKTVEYAVVDGAVDLVKTYGFMHTVYLVYVLAFTVAAIAVAFYAILKKKLVFYRYVVIMLMIAITNVVVWLVEKFIGGRFEFLSASYIFTCLLMVLLYAELSEHGLVGAFHTVVDTDSVSAALPPPERTERTSGKTVEVFNFFDPQLIGEVYGYYTENKILTRREAEMLILLLQGLKQSEIMEKLFITKNTVKTHTSNIYSKLGVTCRDELVRAVSSSEAIEK